MDIGEGFLPTTKPLLDNVISEASHILNLSEALSSGHHKQDSQEKHVQLSGSSLHTSHGSFNLGKNISDHQRHPTPSNQALMSEIETLKGKLGYVQQQHQSLVRKLQQSICSAQCSNSKLIVEQGLSLGQNKMQLFEQRLQLSNGKVLCLNQNLTGTGGQIQEGNKIMSAEPDHETVEVKRNSPKFDFKKSRDDIQALNQAVEMSELKEDADVKTLRMQLSVSEEKIISLQSKLMASDQKLQSLEQKLIYTEQKVQSMQERLITTKDKVFYLEEALMSSEEIVQSLKKALQESESQANTAKSQLEFLQELSFEDQKTVKKISKFLGASEEQYWERVPEIEVSLENYKRQVDILHQALSRAESMHKEEVEQLTNKMEKQAMDQQNLQHEVLDLSKKLIQEQLQARKDLVGSVKYNEQEQKTTQAVRQADMTQTDNLFCAMGNHSKTNNAGTTKESFVQHDMQRGRLTYGLKRGERPLQACLNSLQEEFVELRENINLALRNDGERDDQRKLDWIKVLEKSEEWKRRAEKLMFENKEGLSDGTDMTSYTGKPLSRTYHSPEVIPQKEDHETYSWPQNLHRPDLVYYKQCQCRPPNGTRYSDSMQPLLTVQKHYNDFQTVALQGNSQGSLRMS